MNSKQKVLLIGWDAADWKVIHPLMDRGLMPNLRNLVDEGVMANIRTLHPVLSPMLWTSIATGKRPHHHGILGFIEPTPDGLHVRPVTNLSRKTKTIWNILNQEGLKTNVIGWWPSHPAENIDGVMVSDQFAKIPKKPVSRDAWSMSDNAVHPRELAAEIKELRLHPYEVTKEILFNFVPEAGRVDQKRDLRLRQCINVICECTSVHAAATHVMETQPWDFMAVYYDAIDHFCHGFMKYHPPKLDFVKQEDFEIYQHVITSAYIFHDMMLGRMLELAGPDTTVILMSDHGFHPDHLRPKLIPAEPAGPAIEHRDYGVFVMKGPGIKRDELIYGLTLLDVTPTILHYLGLPVGDDMDGRVITEAFEQEQPVRTIPSWDLVGPSPQSLLADVNQTEQDPEETQRALQQLVELGYIDELDPDREKTVRGAINELSFNRARSFMDAGQFADALPSLVQLYNSQPMEYRYGIQLALCLKALNRVADLERVVHQLNETRMLDAANAVTKLSKYDSLLRERRAAVQDQHRQEHPDADPPKPTLTDLLSPQESKEYMELRSKSVVNSFALDFLQGFVHLSNRQFPDAVRMLNQAMRKGGARPSFYGMIGEALLRSRKIDLAEEAFEKGLEMDPTNAALILGMAWVHFHRKRYQKAVDEALHSISLRFHQPMAHYLLGSALQHLHRPEDALQALEVALAQNPNYALAHSRMGYLYRQLGRKTDSLRSFELAKQAREISRTQRLDDETSIQPVPLDAADALAILPERQMPKRNVELLPILADAPPGSKPIPSDAPEQEIITIVAGLPRSGTSMMMQILQAGGLPIWSDGNRQPDEDNPNGYLELDSVKHLNINNTFMDQARGCVVKVIAQLLAYLPAELHYRVIFMDRDFDEIIASQKIMLNRSGKAAADLEHEKLRLLFARQKIDAMKMLGEKGVPVLQVPYAGVIENPVEAARRINQFTTGTLDQKAMAAAIDEKLYRNRKPEWSRST